MLWSLLEWRSTSGYRVTPHLVPKALAEAVRLAVDLKYPGHDFSGIAPAEKAALDVGGAIRTDIPWEVFPGSMGPLEVYPGHAAAVLSHIDNTSKRELHSNVRMVKFYGWRSIVLFPEADLDGLRAALRAMTQGLAAGDHVAGLVEMHAAGLLHVPGVGPKVSE